MFLINAFTARAAIVIISTLIGAVFIFGLVVSVLAFRAPNEAVYCQLTAYR